MGLINENIRNKKLYKEGSEGQEATKDSNGEIVISKEKAAELDSLNDISELFNDDSLYQANKFLLKQVEDLRTDVEELHTFIKDAFGKDSKSAAGNSHLINVDAISFDGKAGQLIITINETEFRFNPVK